MKNLTRFGFLAILVLVLIPAGILLLSAPRAVATDDGVILSVDFHTLNYNQPGTPANYPLWAINFGDFGQVYGPNGDASSVSKDVTNGVESAALCDYPDATPGNYTNAELAQLQTGYSYGASTTFPSLGHPVYFANRTRWTNNYQATPGGSAVGTSGLWEWNSYFDFSDPYNPVFYPANAFGFTWIDNGGLPQPGLTAMVVVNNIPVSIPVTVDMSQYHNYVAEWSINPGNIQTVRFYVDGVLVGFHVLPQGLPPLSVELWSDNTHQYFDETGNVVTDYLNPPAAQCMYIDKVVVLQPDHFLTTAEIAALGN